jgi:2-C-methyl-D-erythritol 4-phosphate cytidylyltransferase
VHSGLESFPEPPGIVLVHDAVRPFVTARTVRKVIVSARKYRAAIVGVRVTETIKEEAKDGFFLRTVPRERLWVAQTPQGFRFDLLLAAHRAAARGRYIGTDDASLVERIGTRVRIVEGEGGNLKITTLQDLEIAELRVKR